jgi:hypothetical protein
MASRGIGIAFVSERNIPFDSFYLTRFVFISIPVCFQSGSEKMENGWRD